MPQALCPQPIDVNFGGVFGEEERTDGQKANAGRKLFLTVLVWDRAVRREELQGHGA